MLGPASTLRPVAEVYVEFKELPPRYRPARVRRRHGLTLLRIDPRATKREAVEFVALNMTREENNAYRRAYGAPPVDQPLPDAWMEEDTVIPIVPPSLALPDTGAHLRPAL